MSSTYNIVAPQVGNLANAETASHLRGDAETDSIRALGVGNITLVNKIQYGSLTAIYPNETFIGTASCAMGLANLRYYMTASNSDVSTLSNTSNYSNFLNYTTGQNNGTASYAIKAKNSDTASYAINASSITDDTVYPYIKSITFTSRNDDWVNINLQGQKANAYGDGQIVGFNNYGTAGGRVNSFYYDTVNGLYVSTKAGVIDRYYGTPVQYVLMWTDNRGGDGRYLYFDSALVITYAMSKTQTITHTFTTGSAYNMGSKVMAISATRAKLGLNSVLDWDSLNSGVIAPTFGSFTTS
jgi:hypothetical protein